MLNFPTAVLNIRNLSLLAAFLLLELSPTVNAQTPLDYSAMAPIFNSNCILCHSGPASPKGLQLDSYQGIKKGSQNGAVALPGNASGSELIRRIRGESQPRMPLTGPPYLSAADINRITQWVNDGMTEGKPSVAASVKAKVRKVGDPVTYSDVAPIFVQRCIKCHRSNAQDGPPEGLSLQSYQQIVRGGERVVIIPGHLEASELIRRIKGIAQPRMPFDGPPWLSDQEIGLISDWINQGARSEDGSIAPHPVGQSVRLHGRLTSRWSLDGLPLVVDGNTRMKKGPQVGDYVRVRGVVGKDGRIYATRIRSR